MSDFGGSIGALTPGEEIQNQLSVPVESSVDSSIVVNTLPTVTVEGIHGQTLFDLLLQFYGGIGYIGQIAAANGGLEFAQQKVEYTQVKLVDLPAERQDIVDHYVRIGRAITTY